MLPNGLCSKEEAFLFDTRMNNSKLSNSIDVDIILYDKTKNKYIFIELLRTGAEQKSYITPHTSHPNKYFYALSNGNFGNRLKFILQNRFAKNANAEYICINYAKEGDRNDNLIKEMLITSVTEEFNIKEPVVSKNTCLTIDQFKLKMNKYLEDNCFNFNV